MRRMAARLQEAGIETPRREARLILAHALGREPATLGAAGDVPEDCGLASAERRARHEPLAYITGRREFWSLEFEVSPATLIPRPDSETLIEAALGARPRRGAVRRILDLGTGTGCLLLAALSEYPEAFGLGVDLSPEAAMLARRNARRLGMEGRSAFLAADWAEALAGRFDLILANPPYIPAPEIAALMPEVSDHEPRLALDGGADGLDAYRRIMAGLPAAMAAGGVAILELGIGQVDAVAALARGAGYSAESRADLAGVPRALLIWQS
ncbi:MAG TPA: peptide chain release factor N(5)-glutamine methyltransferase [Acetobacteraceae bacterium]|nr:peptide chain release factor N(5)-glutamine methyltransferase [Acetobacteraceae bacterium]